MRAVEAEGARVQRETVSGLSQEVDYLSLAARRADAQLQEREKELAEAAQALRDEAARARLLEEELMRCQVRPLLVAWELREASQKYPVPVWIPSALFLGVGSLGVDVDARRTPVQNVAGRQCPSPHQRGR